MKKILPAMLLTGLTVLLAAAQYAAAAPSTP